MPPHDEIAALKAQNAELVVQMYELAAQNAEPRAHLAKDSHNSSKPPVMFSYLITSSSRHRVPRSPWRGDGGPTP
jgi:hypothetical protein